MAGTECIARIIALACIAALTVEGQWHAARRSRTWNYTPDLRRWRHVAAGNLDGKERYPYEEKNSTIMLVPLAVWPDEASTAYMIGSQIHL